ncbi:MAG: V-type ATP synthase subunit D [Chitinispirillaceae bacterium]|nr:V-type ATP synthase subunit D [Chitinispirillaceae bacterium]
MLNLAPTKTNLFKLRDELKFARQGFELLDQKRKILINELLALVDQCVDYQEQIDKRLARAFVSYEHGVLQVGKLKVHHLAATINITTSIAINKRRVMGVALPVVATEFTEHPPYFSPRGTTFHIDDAQVSFKEALKMMGHLAELKISVLRLAAEVHKTIRKVNALERIAIPDLEETVKYIESRLEENERDMVILMKKVKQRLEAKRTRLTPSAQGVGNAPVT